MDNTKVDRMEVFTVVERGERNFWVKVGSAFVNRDASLTVILDAFPLNGRLQVRPAEPREAPVAASGRRSEEASPGERRPPRR